MESNKHQESHEGIGSNEEMRHREEENDIEEIAMNTHGDVELNIRDDLERNNNQNSIEDHEEHLPNIFNSNQNLANNPYLKNNFMEDEIDPNIESVDRISADSFSRPMNTITPRMGKSEYIYFLSSFTDSTLYSVKEKSGLWRN